VSDFLGIEPKDAINFASQLDMPYLLRTSAAEVARTLGDLTNVSAIFEASREALRRKTSFSSTYRTREGDLATLEPRLARYDDLPARRSAIERAEKAFSAAQDAQNRLSRLEDVLLTLQTASARLRAAESATGPLPDIERLLDLYNRYKSLFATLTALQNASASLSTAEASLEELTGQIENLSVEYDNALHEAGTCPTCGQSTEGVHTHG
jgi:DNA repair exonuclease SbcCD ATPase subunit